MNKIWIFQKDPNGTCCGCAGKTGPCSSCFTCSGYSVTSIQTILSGGAFPPNKIARFGSGHCQLIFSNSGSLMQTVSNYNDYSSGIPNYFNYQVSLASGDIVTIYCEDLDPLPITNNTYPSGVFGFPPQQRTEIKQKYQEAQSFFNLTVAPQIAGKSGIMVNYGIDIAFITKDSGNLSSIGTEQVFTNQQATPSCELLSSAPAGINANLPWQSGDGLEFNTSRAQFYSFTATNQGYFTSEAYLPDFINLSGLNAYNINSYRSTIANGAQFFLSAGGCSSLPPTPVDPDSIYVDLPSTRGFIKQKFQINRIIDIGQTPSFGNSTYTGVKQACVSVACQNNGYISITKANGSPVSISGRLVNLLTGQFS